MHYQLSTPNDKYKHKKTIINPKLANGESYSNKNDRGFLYKIK